MSGRTTGRVDPDGGSAGRGSGRTGDQAGVAPHAAAPAVAAVAPDRPQYAGRGSEHLVTHTGPPQQSVFRQTSPARQSPPSAQGRSLQQGWVQTRLPEAVRVQAHSFLVFLQRASQPVRAGQVGAAAASSPVRSATTAARALPASARSTRRRVGAAAAARSHASNRVPSMTVLLLGGRQTPPAPVCSPGKNGYATVNGMIMPRAKCGAPVAKSGTKQMAKWSPAARSSSR